MKEIKVTYNGDFATTANCGNSPIVLHTDASAQSSAAGKAYTPVDMLVTSLGACMLSIMGMAARNHGVSIDGAEATMAYTQDAITHAVKTVTATFNFGGMTLTDTEKNILRAAARACPVGSSLNPNIEKTLNFEF